MREAAGHRGDVLGQAGRGEEARANADLIGLQEANGVRFRENAQLFGVVAP